MATMIQIGLALSGSTGTGSFVGSTSPTITTPTIATSLTFSPTSGGIIGTTTNDSVAAGYVGEIVTANVTAASATAIGVASGNPTNITSISLTAGEWAVIANGGIQFNGQTGQVAIFWTSLTSATLPDASLRSGIALGANTINASQMAAPSTILQLAGTTTVYLSCQATFTSTATKYGTITATRIR